MITVVPQSKGNDWLPAMFYAAGGLTGRSFSKIGKNEGATQEL